MLFTSEYQDVRDSIRAGDLIAFGGDCFVSRLIKRVTRCPVSHVGVVMEVNGRNGVRRVKLIESTTLAGRSMVQTTFLSERLRTYSGLIWWLPLSHIIRHSMDGSKFWSTLWSSKGRPYDYKQVVHFGWDRLRLFAQREDPTRLFCSELVALGYKSSGVLPVWLNSSEVRPVDLCGFRIYSHNYHQLKGRRVEIKNFNTLDPTSWRN